MTLADQPSELEILQAAQKRSLNSVHTSLPGVVKSYNGLLQTAEVELTIQLPSANGTLHTVPPLLDVPVVFPRGGGFAVTFPLDSGDGVLVVFSEEDYSKWRLTDSSPVEPSIRRRHGIYPFAIPGAFSLPNTLTPLQIDGSAAYLSHSSGTGVKVSSSGVQLGALDPISELGLDFVALSTSVDSQLEEIRDLLKTWTVVAADGGAALKAAAGVKWLLPSLSVAASDVEAT